MDWKKISDDCGISERQIRKVVASLRKFKLMPAPDRVHEVDEMKGYLRQGRMLTVPQLVDLIRNPDMLRALGAKAAAARLQIESLDNPDTQENGALALLIVMSVTLDESVLAALEAWIKATIPARTCTYHYLAVRVLLAARDVDRADVIRRMKYAFMLVRKRPSFAGWWTMDKNRKVPATIYHRPTTVGRGRAPITEL